MSGMINYQVLARWSHPLTKFSFVYQNKFFKVRLFVQKFELLVLHLKTVTGYLLTSALLLMTKADGQLTVLQIRAGFREII